ncbi:MAG: hypothetical protein KDK39_06060 [Leptospiraceae bacterium]|nr:hypothetical protein [Leptospiraceae bacterium]
MKVVYKLSGVLAIAALLSTVLILNSCGKKSDDGLLWLGLMGMGSPPPAAPTTEESNGSPETTTAETGSTSEETVGGFDIVLPSAAVSQNGSPEGDFEGVTFAGTTTDTSGFISVIFSGGSQSATEVANALLAILNANGSITSATVVSSQQASGASDTQLLNLQVTTGSSMTPTDLSNLILTLFGSNIENGTVTNLPQPVDESSDTEFRVTVQITYDSESGVLLGIGTSTESGYDEAESVLTGILDGTNFGPSTSEQSVYTNTFISVGPPKADFLFVVDNSGSMAQEQTAVSNVATSFFDRIEGSGSDFQIGVITTDSDTLRSPGFTNGRTEFVNAIQAGINGSGTESGLYFSEKSLLPGGGVISQGHPRSESSLSVVILSDEGDSYSSYSGGSTFDTSGNVFTSNNYRVYAIIGLDATGQPGKCTGTNGTKATSSNTTDTQIYATAQNSGGASSSICSNDFSAFLDIIASQGVGSASAYQLTKTPISSSIAVSVNGAAIDRNAENGYMYDSISNSLVFYGSAVPASGQTITVVYNSYDSNQVALSSAMMASIRNGGPLSLMMALSITLLAAAIIAILWIVGSRRSKQHMA